MCQGYVESAGTAYYCLSRRMGSRLGCGQILVKARLAQKPGLRAGGHL